MIRLPIFILMWAGFIAIEAFPLLVAAPFAAYLEWSWWVYFLPIGVAPLGLIVVPFMYAHRYTNYNDLPKWTRPWANPEDWQGQVNHHSESLPRWWVESKGNTFKAWYKYHAIRNPANGLRSIEWLDLDVTPDLVRFRTSSMIKNLAYEPAPLRRCELKTAWYFAWQGYRAGFKIVHIWSDTHHLVIKFGWRVEPSDALDREVTELKKDTSFATKFLFKREG